MSSPSSHTQKRDNAGILVCLGVIAIGVLILGDSRQFTMLGAVFPRTIATLMIVLSAIYVVMAWFRPNAQVAHAQGSSARRLGMYAVVLAWALAIAPVGFLTTSLVCYGLGLMVANYGAWTLRKVLVYFGSGATILICLYLLFKFVLHVPLPVGMWM